MDQGLSEIKDFIDRIERLEAEKQGVAEGIKSVYQEAKATGFDPVTMRKIIALRKKDQHEIEEEAVMLEMYLQALNSSE